MIFKWLSFLKDENKTPFTRRKIISSVLIFSLTLLFSWGVLYYQTQQHYQAEVWSRLSLSLRVLDDHFKQADATVRELSQQMTGNCEHDRVALMKTLIEVSSIQTLSVIKGGNVVCSTYPRIIGAHIPDGELHRFNAMISSVIIPGQLIFTLKTGSDDLFILASLHGSVLLGIINILDEQNHVHINYQENWFSADNRFFTRPNPDNLYLKSPFFPYSISTKIDSNQRLTYFFSHNMWLLGVLVLFSLLPAIGYLKYGDRREMIRAIKKGINTGQFVPFSQGIVDSQGRLVGCEILVRWFYRSHLIRPDEFIPVAERSGLIVLMSHQLIRDTHTILYSQLDGCPDDFYLSFNICPLELTDLHAQGLIDAVNGFRHCDKLSNIKIILELTERQIVQHTPETQANIDRLHQLGVDIYIDDFGTGYSSFENILQLNIDGLKIDKHFVDRYPDDVISANLIDNMTDLAARLNVSVVAEGVETQHQADALIEKGVDYLQGYHYCRPVNLFAFTSKINCLKRS